MIVTKDTMIGELLTEDFDTAMLLMSAGMHCVGCPSSQMETIEEACAVHNMDYGQVVNALNEYFKVKEGSAESAEA